MSRHAWASLALSAALLAAPALAEEPSPDAPVDPWGETDKAPWATYSGGSGDPNAMLPPGYRVPEEVSDPRLAMGGLLVVTGGLLVAGGAAALADVEARVVVSSSVCNPNGSCVISQEARRDPSDESAGVAMIAGGAATALFGGVLLGHGLGESEPFPHKSTRRLAAGMVLTGYGVGTAVGASAMLMHAALEGSDAVFVGFAMFAPAVGLLATGVPLWITGSRPEAKKKGGRVVPEEEKDVFRSPTLGSIGLGMVGLGAGTIIAGVASSVEGDLRDQVEQREQEERLGFFEGSDRPDMELTILGTMTAGVTMFSLGLPLAIIGLGKTKPHQAHASAPTLRLPDVDVGMGGAKVTWRY